jgi:putative heme-binding domain-containing protein
MRIIAALSLFALFALPHSAVFAQGHGYIASEIEDGRRIYQSNCATCHGAFGDAVPGIDLGREQFKTAATDEDLVRIIRTGVPGTSMPPFNFTETQAGTVVAFLRNMTATPVDRNVPLTALGPPGDAMRGKLIFEGKGNCLSCHCANGAGETTGLDLSAISAPRVGRAPAELQRKLLQPNTDVRAENRTMRVVTKAGVTITGKLLNQDTHSLQILDYSKHALASFKKSDLQEFGLVPSPMPSFKDQLTAQELSDVLTYLITLKGIAP